MEPHLKMLRRQTGKWEKRSELEEELKNLENNYFSFKLTEIKNNLAVISLPLAALEKEIGQKQKNWKNFRWNWRKLTN